jgi:RNA polymerase sigma-70 factor, ECF subfamily
MIAEVTSDLYRDLRRIASRHLDRERSNHTLQPTALVHEAYLKLAGGRDQRFNDDMHFLSVASRAMRQVLVDYARSRAAGKRKFESGGDAIDLAAIPGKGQYESQLTELIALDDAVAALAAENPRLARVIEMRYFGGMTAEAIAEATGMSVHVVRHDVRFAEAWLRRRLAS